jgi:hypothetical protein
MNDVGDWPPPHHDSPEALHDHGRVSMGIVTIKEPPFSQNCRLTLKIPFNKLSGICKWNSLFTVFPSGNYSLFLYIKQCDQHCFNPQLTIQLRKHRLIWQTCMKSLQVASLCSFCSFVSLCLNKLNSDLPFYKFSWRVGQIFSQLMCSWTQVNFWVIWWSLASSSQIFATVTLLQQLTDFATANLFQTFDGGPNLGSTARSICPSLNLLYN